MVKVTIIGSGPAGITTGIYLTRAGIENEIITTDSGSLMKAGMIENYYGLDKPLKGPDLQKKGVLQYLNLGGKIIEDEIVGLDFEESLVAIGLKGKYPADYIVIATGVSHLMPKIKGLNEDDVSFCAICDAFFYKKKDVAVIGSGNYALHEAEILKQVASSVTILTNCDALKDASFPTNSLKIKEVVKDENGFTVVFEDESELKVAGIFIALGIAGATALAKKIGADIEDGQIAVDANRRTTVPHLYAVGDAAGGIKQIAKAVCDGVVASYDIMQEIRKES